MTDKYAFGWDDDAAVECAELDALLEDIEAVLSKHGVGFVLEHDYEERSKIMLVKYDRAVVQAVGYYSIALIESLSDYREGIDWLDRARSAYDAKCREVMKQKEALRAARENELREARENAKALRAQEVIRDGLIIDGTHYKLVKE